MAKTKIALLYERLSRDDELQGESFSIQNQKAMLEDYAQRNGFPRFKHFTDDGVSGTRFDRPGFMAMMEEVEDGNVEAIIVKDMSRLGRDYLKVGQVMELLRQRGVRLIAINDNVDTDKGDNDMTPFLNIMYEFYARDTSRKIRSVFKAKGMSGKHLTGTVIYGYLWDEKRENWLVDEEAAAVVRRIFALCAAGQGPSQIARLLKREQVLCPTTYAYKTFGVAHSSLNLNDPYGWSDSTIANMLENEIYLGNTINLRYSTRSYKDKRKVEHPREECMVLENTHPALVSHEVWDIVQRVRQHKRRPTKMDEQNKYSGLVVCADCGSTMVLHRAHTMSRSYNHFTCRTYKKDGTLCTAHYIRECVLDDVVLEDLRRVTAMAREHTQEFAAYIGSRQSAEIRKEMRGLERELTTMKKRSRELDSIFKRLYEDSVLGRITAEQFQTLSGSYTQEMEMLNKAIPEKETAIQRLREQVSGTDHFISLAKRYTDIQELTPELLRLFIRKIVVHEKDVKWSKHAQQTVEIHYNDIGCVELPQPKGQSTPKGA